MSDDKETVVNERRPTGKDLTGIYASSTDALKQINEAFDYWSGQITATSLQMCYALIGANWVIFGSVGSILHSRYAIVSLLLVLLAPALNMVSSYALAECMRGRFGYAVSNRKRWEAEFQHEKVESTTWPYSKWTEEASIATRLIKVILPLASGICLIIGAVIYRPMIAPAPGVVAAPAAPAISVEPPRLPSEKQR
jgi:hypothetical protein